MRKLAYENGLKKGPWTEEEDLKLIQYVNTHGPGKWRALPKKAGLQRCGKSCRLRWTNYLRPDIKRGRFSFEEEESIIQLHRVLGNKWSAIAAILPGRTDNEIKNYWNTHIRKRLHRNGIDPVTHIPTVEFSEVSSVLNSALLYLSNLFNLQTLVNPTVLTLSALLASSSPSNKQNQELFLNNHINPVNPNPNKQNPYFTSSPANFPSTQNLNQRHLTQTNDSPYLTKNLENVKVESNQDILMRTFLIDDCFTAPKFSNQSTAQASEKSSFHPSNSENTIPICQNFNYDSVLSSPMSNPTPLISSPTFINNSSTEDERESYCSNLFKLDIQESFEFNDFL